MDDLANRADIYRVIVREYGAPAAAREPVAWANWRVDSASYVPFGTAAEARASVRQSEIAATQYGPYRVVGLVPITTPQPPASALPAVSAEPVGEVVAVDDDQCKIGLYDTGIRIGDLLYTAPVAAQPESYEEAGAFIWDGDEYRMAAAEYGSDPDVVVLYRKSASTPPADKPRDLEELRNNVMHAIRDHGSKEPEEDETWESWHIASYGLLWSAVNNLFADFSTTPPADGQPERKLPDLVVTKDGVPFKDQAEGVRQFKAACLKAADGQAQQTLNQIYDLLGFGELAREPHILIYSLSNALRRSRCLSAIERHFTAPTPPEPEDDGVPGEECLLRWGAEPEGYAEHFRDALTKLASLQAQQDADIKGSTGRILDVLSQAARDVLAERQRQIEAEGWTPEHDDAHTRGEMANAAACYANGSPDPYTWPWAEEWWKPFDHRRNCVKAGALVIAEIERLDRAAARAQQGGQS